MVEAQLPRCAPLTLFRALLACWLLGCATSSAPPPPPAGALPGPTRSGPLVIGDTQLVGSEGLGLSPQGTYLLVERDNRFHVLTSTTLQEVAQLEKPAEAKAALALYSRRPILLSPDESLVLSSYTDAAEPGARVVAVNELPSGKLRHRHRFEKASSMGFAADGSAYFVATKGAVSVFEVSGALRKELPVETAVVALGVQGKLLAFTEVKAQSPVKVIDVGSASAVAEWTLTGPYPYSLRVLAFSPDGTRLAAAGGHGGKVHVWAATTGKLLFQKQPRDFENDDLLFAADGTLWSVRGTGGPVGWDASGNELTMLESFSLDAGSIGVGPTIVAAVDSHGTLLRWDRRTSSLMPGPGLRAEATLLKFSADDRVLHAISLPRRAVASWDSERGALSRITSFRTPADYAWLADDLAPENNAAWLVALPKNEAGEPSFDGVRPIDGGKRFLRVEHHRVQLLPGGRPLELPFRVVEAHASPDAEWLLVQGMNAMETTPFRLWSLRSGEQAERQPAHPANRARWAPTGSVAALWFHQGRQVALFSLDGQSETLDASAPIESLAFSPDGTVIALGCGDGVIRRFDVATRKPLPELIHRAKRGGSDRGLPALAYSNGGRKLASGNREGTILVWDVGAD